MSPVTVFGVDVFAQRRFAGNPAAVVPDARGLGAGTMQAIAAELNLSETAFVFPGGSDEAVRAPGLDPSEEVFVRFFTPRTEVPTCGHATLAAHAVRALGSGEGAGRVWQRSPGGRWLAEWRVEGPERVHMTMVQSPVRFDPPLADDGAREVWRALGLERAPAPGLPLQVVSTGHAKVMVPVADVRELRGLSPDMKALERLGERLGVPGFFVFAPVEGEDWSCEARMFAPGIGIDEDPVNGSGHGPLGAYAVRHRVAGLASGRFRSRMGDALGRPGLVDVDVVREAGVPARVRVGGMVIPVWQGTLRTG